MKQKSMYRKLLLFGFTICVIPVLALGVFSYWKSAESVRSHVDKTNIDLLRQVAGNIEQMLKTTDSHLNQVVNSTALQDALYQPVTSRQFALNNSFRKDLSNLQSSDSPVSDVVLLNYSNNWLINNDRLYAFDEFPQREELLQFNRLPYDSNWSIVETSLLGSPSTEVSGCQYTIALSKKLPVKSSEKRGLALAYIPSCRLANWVELHSGFQDMIIVSPEQQILFHQDPSMVGSPAGNTGYLDEEALQALTEPTGQLQLNSGSGDYTLTYSRSGYNGWLYLLLTDIHMVTEQSREIGWVTFWISLLIVLVTLYFVWLGSTRMYTPVRTLLQSIAKRQPVSQKGSSDEFQIIREHMEHLFTSNSYMEREISQNTRQLRGLFLARLYLGQEKLQETTDKMKRYGFEERLKSWSPLFVLTLQVDQLSLTAYPPEDLDLLLFAANNIVEESIGAKWCLTPVIIDQTQVTLVGTSGQTEEDLHRHIYKLTETIRKNIEHYLKLQISIGVSLPFQSIHDAPRAYREGMDALKQRLKLGVGVTVYFSNMNAGQPSFLYQYPRQLLHELVDAIKLGDEEKGLELLKQWMQEIFTVERRPDEYQIALVRLLNDLMILMQESGITLQQLEAEEYSLLYRELLQQYIPSEIENWFARRLLKPMTAVFRERGESQYRNLSEAMIDLIHRRYDTDFTLEECAAVLHYNTHYLSGVFKKETQLLFSEYLAMYRMNMAKKWLVETDMAVKDIAERLTYNNSQNFIRFFRKQEGITPGQYREKNRPST
jgi:AraC-like DNA-binding protein